MKNVPMVAFLFDVPEMWRHASNSLVQVFVDCTERTSMRFDLNWLSSNLEFYFSRQSIQFCAKKVSSASCFAPSWISTLEVVVVFLTECIRRNKLWIHHRLSRSITSSSFFPLRFTRVLATDLATTAFTFPPFFWLLEGTFKPFRRFHQARLANLVSVLQ